MKSLTDPRHKKRQKLVEELYSSDFHNQTVSKQTNTILSKRHQIDKVIATIAPDFPTEKINKVDLAILRLAVYELTIEKQIPPKVVLDEAIELAKEYAGDNAPAFINGALGRLLES